LPLFGLLPRARLVKRFKFRDVRARAKVCAFAAQDYGAQVSTRRDAREYLRQAFEHRARQSVALRGAFESNVGDRAALLKFNFSAQVS
jgi:hypothetical protein